ncbi:MAG: hypothetical protein ACYTA5_24175, partial [Planctomycetota bacterium]
YKPLTRFEKPHKLCHASFCDPYYQYRHAGFSNLWVRVRDPARGLWMGWFRSRAPPFPAESGKDGAQIMLYQ